MAEKRLCFVHGVKGVVFACVNNRQSSSTFGAHNAHHIKLHMIIYPFAWRVRIILKHFIHFWHRLPPCQCKQIELSNITIYLLPSTPLANQVKVIGRASSTRTGKKIESEKNPKMVWKLDLAVHNSNRLHAVLSASRKVEARWSAKWMRRNAEKGFNCNFPTAPMTGHKTQ